MGELAWKTGWLGTALVAVAGISVEINRPHYIISISQLTSPQFFSRTLKIEVSVHCEFPHLIIAFVSLMLRTSAYAGLTALSSLLTSRPCTSIKALEQRSRSPRTMSSWKH